MGKIVVNQQSSNQTSPPSPQEVGIELKKAVNALKGNFFDLETGQVNYQKMKGSEAFDAYVETSGMLKNFDLNLLSTQSEKLAFWINIYNALTVHGIVELNVENSVREVRSFFKNVSYQISDYVFSLDDIEHGILRQNQKQHFFSSRPFGSSDPRNRFIMERLEPRIHFTLVCGSKSCPPIGTYQEEKIEEQLSMAASSFINSDNVILHPERSKIEISKIFQWYGKDFGSKRDVLRFIGNYRRNSEEKTYILEHLHQLSVSYLDYDWGLNH